MTSSSSVPEAPEPAAAPADQPALGAPAGEPLGVATNGPSGGAPSPLWPRQAWSWAAGLLHAAHATPRRRFWSHVVLNLIIGGVIEIGLHVAHERDLGVVVNTERMISDQMSRLFNGLCEARVPGLSMALRCAQDGGTAETLLVEVDDALWRSPRWDGGEPARAPREALAQLVEQSLAWGAQRVVVDVLVEDRGTAASAPEVGTAAALARHEDAEFARRLQAALARHAPAAAGTGGAGTPLVGPRLVLVRTAREPLPGQQAVEVAELRTSASVDAMVASSGGVAAVAAPYFLVDSDGITRHWLPFRVLCERKPQAPEQGLLRVVPSVQLLLAATEAGVDGTVLSPPAGEPVRRVHGVLDTAASSCVPPALTPQAVAPQVPGPGDTRGAGREAHHGRPAGERENEALDCAEEPGMAERYACSIGQALARSGSNAGGLRWGPAPAAEDRGNRVVFTRTDAQVQRVPASLVLNATQATGLHALFRDRVVVIGQTFAESGDFFDTPLGMMPGASLLVNAIESMRNRGLLRDPEHGWGYWLLLAGQLLLVAVVFAKFDSMLGTLASMMLMVLVVGSLSLGLYARGIWLDLALPVLGIYVHRIVKMAEERTELRRFRARGDVEAQ